MCGVPDQYSIGWTPSTSTGSTCDGGVKPTSADHVYHFLLVTVNGPQVTVTPTDELGRTFDQQMYDLSP